MDRLSEALQDADIPFNTMLLDVQKNRIGVGFEDISSSYQRLSLIHISACKTSISEAEVEYEEQQGHFWHLRYPFKDGSGWLELATTRPETLLGDTAVAVNPEDARYRSAVGKTLVLPLVGREIQVVADSYCLLYTSRCV